MSAATILRKPLLVKSATDFSVFPSWGFQPGNPIKVATTPVCACHCAGHRFVGLFSPLDIGHCSHPLRNLLLTSWSCCQAFSNFVSGSFIDSTFFPISSLLTIPCRVILSPPLVHSEPLCLLLFPRSPPLCLDFQSNSYFQFPAGHLCQIIKVIIGFRKVSCKSAVCSSGPYLS